MSVNFEEYFLLLTIKKAVSFLIILLNYEKLFNGLLF